MNPSHNTLFTHHEVLERGVLTIHPGLESMLLRKEWGSEWKWEWVVTAELMTAQGRITQFPAEHIIGHDLAAGVYTLKNAVFGVDDQGRTCLDLSGSTLDAVTGTEMSAMKGISHRIVSAGDGDTLVSRPLQAFTNEGTPDPLGASGLYGKLKSGGFDSYAFRAVLALPGHPPVILAQTPSVSFNADKNTQAEKRSVTQQYDAFARKALELANDCGVRGSIPESFVIIECCPTASFSADTSNFGRGMKDAMKKGEEMHVAFLHSVNGSMWPLKVTSGADNANQAGYSPSVLNLSTSPTLRSVEEATFSLPEKPFVFAIEEPGLKGGLMRTMNRLRLRAQSAIFGGITPLQGEGVKRDTAYNLHFEKEIPKPKVAARSKI